MARFIQPTDIRIIRQGKPLWPYQVQWFAPGYGAYSNQKSLADCVNRILDFPGFDDFTEEECSEYGLFSCD